MIKAFIFVMILGVAVGMGIVFKDQLIALLNPPPAPPPPPPAVVQPKPVEPPKVVEPEVLTPTAKPPAPIETKRGVPPPALGAAQTGPEDDAAKALVERGRALMEKLDFVQAGKLFNEAGQKKIGLTMKNNAAGWEKKAKEYDAATHHIPISDFATAENAFVVETQDGREMRGIIKSQTDDQIVLQVVPATNPASLGKTTIPIPAIDIKARKALTLDQRREDFLQLLGGLESGASITRSTDYYDLVYISKRLGLGRECLEYLNRAYNGGKDHEADPYLGDSFRKEVIRRAIDRCSLMLAGGRAKRFVEDELNKLLRTLPSYAVAEDEVESFRIKIMAKVRDDFKSTIRLSEAKKPDVAVAVATKKAEKSAPAQNARELVAEEQIEIVVENEGVTGKGAAASVVADANAKYDEGMKAYRGFRQGTNGNNNKVLEQAMHLLESAVDMYDKALKLDPTNKSVLDRQTEANMIVYACKKYKTL